ncbi:phosphatidylserine decarboxylase proenzyme, mitochondrial-like isoform X1 [Tubulanus polymorphus]|uniref:phosphatidylserine decarboxylase proenzyme, mitochondrial-like isoform X1 n=1 Tax=Tubulanus polymorphus TaxID=672921 RepID=UPI003DA2D405
MEPLDFVIGFAICAVVVIALPLAVILRIRRRRSRAAIDNLDNSRRKNRRDELCRESRRADSDDTGDLFEISVTQPVRVVKPKKRVQHAPMRSRYSYYSHQQPHLHQQQRTGLAMRRLWSRLKRYNSNVTYRSFYMIRLLFRIFTLNYALRGFKRRNSRRRFNKKVTLYRKMPLKAISRLWGKMNNMNLPKWLRSPALKFYIWMFGCNIEEAAIEDLKHYKNLGEFFRRPLKPDVRPVNPAYSVTSPADGKILHYGLVDNGHLEQVKGIRYSLHGFLGPTTWSEDTRREAAAPVVVGDDESNANARSISEREYEQSIKTNPENELYHCVIYLAPGDYHRFHSPTEWNVCYRRHFPGELLSVSPGIARWVQGLFNFNERAVYYGSWVHGFFSMTAVGATNVGSIKVNFDEDLVTNCGRRWKEGTYFDRGFTNNNGKGIAIKKGDEFGEFNLGSTIVLIFEAPKDFKFEINEGQKIRYGEPVGCIS